MKTKRIGPNWSVELAGFEISIKRTTKNKFTVIYGKQRFENMGYRDASQCLGACIMHALTCEDRLEVRPD